MLGMQSSVCGVSGLKGNRVRISNSPAAVCASYRSLLRILGSGHWRFCVSGKDSRKTGCMSQKTCNAFSNASRKATSVGSLYLEFIPQRGCPLF